ncbi:MAG: hypothetical protein PVF54_10170 [Anaerolineae bacterium]
MTQVVEGDPIHVAGRELVPLVRETSRVRRRAFVGGEGVGVQGRGFVHLRPVAILDRSEAGERRLRSRGGTARTVRAAILVALVVPWVAAVLIYLLSRCDDSTL